MMMPINKRSHCVIVYSIWTTTTGYGGKSSSGRPLRSYCLLGIPHSSYGAALHVATDATGSLTDSQTTFALLLLMIGGDTAIKIKSDNGLEATRLYNYVSLNQSFKLPSDFVFLM
jgi:hypothetical protein